MLNVNEVNMQFSSTDKQDSEKSEALNRLGQDIQIFNNFNTDQTRSANTPSKGASERS